MKKMSMIPKIKKLLSAYFEPIFMGFSTVSLASCKNTNLYTFIFPM